MTLKSNKYLRSLPVAMLALAVCSSVHADNGDSIDITFRANIRDANMRCFEKQNCLAG